VTACRRNSGVYGAVVINIRKAFSVGKLAGGRVMILPAGIARFFWSRDITGMYGIAVATRFSGYCRAWCVNFNRVQSGVPRSLWWGGADVGSGCSASQRAPVRRCFPDAANSKSRA